jgi:hypothetical protein
MRTPTCDIPPTIRAICFAGAEQKDELTFYCTGETNLFLAFASASGFSFSLARNFLVGGITMSLSSKDGPRFRPTIKFLYHVAPLPIILLTFCICPEVHTLRWRTWMSSAEIEMLRCWLSHITTCDRDYGHLTHRELHMKGRRSVAGT